MEIENKGLIDKVKSLIKKSTIAIFSQPARGFLYAWISGVLDWVMPYRSKNKRTYGLKAIQSLDNLFIGWLNNRMTVLLMLVEHRKPRDPKTILRITFFLEDLRHHFMAISIDAQVTEAFEYLNFYLNAYPAVTDDQSQTAKRMIRRIYEALGYEIKINTETRVQKQESHGHEKKHYILFQGMALA